MKLEPSPEYWQDSKRSYFWIEFEEINLQGKLYERRFFYNEALCCSTELLLNTLAKNYFSFKMTWISNKVK